MPEPVSVTPPSDKRASEAVSCTCCSPGTVELLPESVAAPLVRSLKAIGHPVRLQIVHLLAHLGGHVCVCDIEARFDLTQPTISHHLRVLREAGLVTSEQRGLFAFYRLDASAMTFLRGRIGEWQP